MDIDSHRPTRSNTAFMAIFLTASLVAMIAGIVRTLQGHFARGSYNDAIIAIGGFAMLATKFGQITRIGGGLCAAGATINGLTYYLNASREIRWLAAVSAQMLILIGCALFVVGTSQWLREAYLWRGSPKEKELLSLKLD